MAVTIRRIKAPVVRIPVVVQRNITITQRIVIRKKQPGTIAPSFGGLLVSWRLKDLFQAYQFRHDIAEFNIVGYRVPVSILEPAPGKIV